MLKQFTVLLASLILLILVLIFPYSILACTYEATIAENHLDFKINSDLDKLAVIQYIRLSGSFLVTKTYSPDIGVPWNHYSDYSNPNCGLMNGNGTIVCIQNGGLGVYWSYEYPSGIYHLLPGGVYGVDFNSPPSYDSIGIEYGILQGTTGESWTLCTRTGDVSTPSPSPIPIPLTKTVFAPGLMGSWNEDAILNCDPNPDSEWTLAPYAEEVYTPILGTLQETGWETLPFYYDWRKPVSENSQKLASFIETNSQTNEKVNFVGHSMGGLVGRGYLDITDGSKLKNMLTIGTPNKGSAYAYPPWEGGEIWSNNLIEKIALTIYLRHCGATDQNQMDIIRQQVPSLQDLLPTYPYLKQIKSDSTYVPSSDENQNTWLNSLGSDSKEVRLGYLSGTGFETVESIQTKDRNKRDIKQGWWVDGRPAGKITSIQGDGTVLLDSAILPNSNWSETINQTHRGLVNSSEGMGKILGFLGTPDINVGSMVVDTQEPNSALVMMGYPATFTLTDQDGKTKQSKNGMVAVMNPKSGNYKINLLPKSDNTLIIVAQFLPNGEVKYKEYNFKGTAPKFKTLNLDLQNPKDDILIP